MTDKDQALRTALEQLTDSIENLREILGCDEEHSAVDQARDLITERDRLRARVAELERLETAIGIVYCEKIKGIAAIDPHDGSPNWWLFAEEARKWAVEMRDRRTASEARERRLRDALELIASGEPSFIGDAVSIARAALSPSQEPAPGDGGTQS